MIKSNNISLGISAFFHNSAAAIVKGNSVIAAVEEERISRIKNDSSFPVQSVRSSLRRAQLTPSSIDFLAFYERPLARYFRSHHSKKAGIASLNDGLRILKELRSELEALGLGQKPLFFFPHHLSHAASAFVPSGFREAMVIVADGVGESTSTSIWRASERCIEQVHEQEYPHSLGLLVSYITEYLGFVAMQDEYKVMGLAAYGELTGWDLLHSVVDLDITGRITIQDDWVITILTGEKRHDDLDEVLFGRRRLPNEPIEATHVNLAASLQNLINDFMRRLVCYARSISGGVSSLCLAGGVAHNCVSIGAIQKDAPFDRLFVQPAAGDAGGALGAAFLPNFIVDGGESPCRTFDPYLGPSYRREECLDALMNTEWLPLRLEDDVLVRTVSRDILNDKIIGWFQGPAEFGSRALGNRSILANPLSPGISNKLNTRIKEREDFRPFAPAVLVDFVNKFFLGRWIDPYMMATATVRAEFRQLLKSVTHVDGSARVQAVHYELNPRFYRLIETFGDDSGFPGLLNTSLNHSSEPMVCSPYDAVQTATRCSLDVLVLNDLYCTKRQ